MPAQVALAAAEARDAEAKLKTEWTTKGAEAYKGNENRDQAPAGQNGKWWLEGYDKAARQGT